MGALGGVAESAANGKPRVEGSAHSTRCLRPGRTRRGASSSWRRQHIASKTRWGLASNQGQPRLETRQVVAQHLHQHGKMVKVPFVPLNTYTSAVWTTQKQRFSASWTHQDQRGAGANRPSRRQAHADASHRRRQPCRRTPGQRPKPGRRQDDQHGHQQRDEWGLL